MTILNNIKDIINDKSFINLYKEAFNIIFDEVEYKLLFNNLYEIRTNVEAKVDAASVI